MELQEALKRRKALADLINSGSNHADTTPKRIPAMTRAREGIDNFLQENVTNPLAARGFEGLGAGLGAALSAGADMLLPEYGYDMIPGMGTVDDAAKGGRKVVSLFKDAPESKLAEALERLHAQKRVSKDRLEGMLRGEGLGSKKLPSRSEPLASPSGISNIIRADDPNAFRNALRKTLENSPLNKSNFRVDDPEGFSRFAERFDDPKAIARMVEIHKTPSTEPYFGRDMAGPLYRTHPQALPGTLHQVPVFQKIDPQGHLGKFVEKGGADPFAWMDAKYGVAKQALADNYDKPLKISTRSDLIAHDDYMENLNPAKHKIEFHIFGDNPRALRVATPGAPSFQRVLTAAQKLKDAGIDVTIVHDRINGMKPELNGLDQLQLQKLGFKTRENAIRVSPAEKRNLEKVMGEDIWAPERTTQSKKLFDLDNELKNRGPKKTEE